MHSEKKERGGIASTPGGTQTRRLSMLYITALSTVALLAILGQIVIQTALQQQSSDALVINIAGRQRMLSQRLSKAALALDVFADERQQNADELRYVVVLWQSSQEGLQLGDAKLGLPGHNSQSVKRLFAQIEPEYESMLRASYALLALIKPGKGSGKVSATAFLPFIQEILAAQSGFLTGMDMIVTQYEREAEEHVAHLRLIEFVLLSLTLLVLLLEGLFIFRPAVRRLRQSFTDLLQANERAMRAEVTRKRAERILALNEALAVSQKDKPHARIVALNHYQVRDKDGIYQNVYQREIDGWQVFACECVQYQQQKICSHSLTASALHSVSSFKPG
jgi:nitrate/nitrite-specific signal transduction histidine kinase